MIRPIPEPDVSHLFSLEEHLCFKKWRLHENDLDIRDANEKILWYIEELDKPEVDPDYRIRLEDAKQYWEDALYRMRIKKSNLKMDIGYLEDDVEEERKNKNGGKS